MEQIIPIRMDWDTQEFMIQLYGLGFGNQRRQLKYYEYEYMLISAVERRHCLFSKRSFDFDLFERIYFLTATYNRSYLWKFDFIV